MWYIIWRGIDEFDRNDLFVKVDICYLKFILVDVKKKIFVFGLLFWNKKNILSKIFLAF